MEKTNNQGKIYKIDNKEIIASKYYKNSYSYVEKKLKNDDTRNERGNSKKLVYK